MHTLLIECEPGLSGLQLAELCALGYGGEIVNPLTARVSGAEDGDVVRLNYLLRQATGVFILMGDGLADSLDLIREVAAGPDYSVWLHPEQSFRVQARRFGQHPFRSPQIAGAVGLAVIDQFLQRRGIRVRVDLDNADVTFHAQLHQDHLCISVDTSGQNLSDRHPRPYQNPASLRPAIAAAMLELSSFGMGKPLLDPMAGGGTIPSEACFVRRGQAAGAFRGPFAFQRLRNLDSGSLGDLRDAEAGSIGLCDVPITASDRSTNALKGMRQNFAAQGILGEINVQEDDAERLEKVEEGSFQLLISNPPFGLRFGNPRKARQTYDRVPSVAVDKGIDEIVMITPHSDWLAESGERAGLRLTDSIPFMHGDLENNMLRLAAPGASVAPVIEPSPG